MKKARLILSILALVFYSAAVIGLFCPFIWQIEYAKGGTIGGSNSGMEAGLNFGAFPQNLPNFLAIVFIVIGFVASLVYLFVTIIKNEKSNKKKKGQPEEVKEFSSAKYLLSIAIFGILCGFVPFLCCSLTLDAYGIAGDQAIINGIHVGYFIGEGAAISGVGALFGGMCLFFTSSGILD